MQVFVVEIAGRGVVAVSNDDRDAVEDEMMESLKADLACLQDAAGNDLWDGSSELFLRDPYPEERAAFENALARSGERDDDPYVLFLVPVVDPTDTEDGEET